MKIVDKVLRFRRDRKLLFGLSVFAVTFAVVVFAVYSLGIYIISSAECPSFEGDPWGAAPMMAFSVWTMSLPLGILVGSILVLFTRYYGISESAN